MWQITTMFRDPAAALFRENNRLRLNWGFSFLFFSKEMSMSKEMVERTGKRLKAQVGFHLKEAGGGWELQGLRWD